jgi:hypothetical protein
MMKKRLIPFRLMPASWGLRGRPYEEAEAAYYLDGEELARRLVEIAHVGDAAARKRALLALDLEYGRIAAFDHDMTLLGIDNRAGDRAAILGIELRHGRITQYDHDVQMTEIVHSVGVDREVALLDVELKHEKISRNEHAKRCATLREEPWVGIIDQGFDPDQGLNGVFFEFDWNEYWIDYLRINGYDGNTDEQVFDQWFSDVCRAQIGDEQMVIPIRGGNVRQKTDAP